MGLEDEERPGPTKRITTPEMDQKFHNIVLRDQGVKMEEMAKIVSI